MLIFIIRMNSSWIDLSMCELNKKAYALICFQRQNDIVNVHIQSTNISVRKNFL